MLEPEGEIEILRNFITRIYFMAIEAYDDPVPGASALDVLREIFSFVEKGEFRVKDEIN